MGMGVGVIRVGVDVGYDVDVEGRRGTGRRRNWNRVLKDVSSSCFISSCSPCSPFHGSLSFLFYVVLD